MEHPDIQITMLTGYPTRSYQQYEEYRDINFLAEGHPVEDMYGSEIRQGDSYFVDEQGRVVLLENQRDYLQEVASVVFYEAK